MSKYTRRDFLKTTTAGAAVAGTVGVGSAVWLRGVGVFGKIVEEMNEWCEANGVKKISSLIGKAHANR